MADVDINPFGGDDRAESRPDKPMDEHIPLIPGVGGSTWEPERGEQETSFGGGESLRTRVLKDKVGGLYQKLSKKLARTSEAVHTNLFDLRDGKLYFRDKSTPLTT